MCSPHVSSNLKPKRVSIAASKYHHHYYPLPCNKKLSWLLWHFSSCHALMMTSDSGCFPPSVLSCPRQFWSKPQSTLGDWLHDVVVVYSLWGGGGGMWWRTHSLTLPTLINIVSTGHSTLVGTGHCPAYVKSEQAWLNTTRVTQQLCSISFIG